MPKCLSSNWGVQRVSVKKSVNETCWKKALLGGMAMNVSVTSTNTMPTVVATETNAQVKRQSRMACSRVRANENRFDRPLQAAGVAERDVELMASRTV